MLFIRPSFPLFSDSRPSPPPTSAWSSSWKRIVFFIIVCLLVDMQKKNIQRFTCHIYTYILYTYYVFVWIKQISEAAHNHRKNSELCKFSRQRKSAGHVHRSSVHVHKCYVDTAAQTCGHNSRFVPGPPSQKYTADVARPTVEIRRLHASSVAAAAVWLTKSHVGATRLAHSSSSTDDDDDDNDTWTLSSCHARTQARQMFATAACVNCFRKITTPTVLTVFLRVDPITCICTQHKSLAFQKRNDTHRKERKKSVMKCQSFSHVHYIFSNICITAYHAIYFRLSHSHSI